MAEDGALQCFQNLRSSLKLQPRAHQSGHPPTRQAVTHQSQRDNLELASLRSCRSHLHADDSSLGRRPSPDYILEKQQVLLLWFDVPDYCGWKTPSKTPEPEEHI